MDAEHAGSPFPSLKQARGKAQPHTSHKGIPRAWPPPPWLVDLCGFLGLAREDFSERVA